MAVKVESKPTVAVGERVRLVSGVRARRGDVPLLRAAKVVGINRDELRRIERGETTQIRFETLVKLCEAYHCSPADLFTLEPVEVEERIAAPLYVGALAAFDEGSLGPAPRHRRRRDADPDELDPADATVVVAEPVGQRRRTGIPTLHR